MIAIMKRLLHRSGCALLLCLAALHPSAQAQTIPNAPTNLTASVISALQISLSWADASTNEDGFKVERSLDGINFSQIAQLAAGVTNYRNAALFPGTAYSYRVRAYNSGGASAFSSIANAVTPTPACPLSVIAWGLNDTGQSTPPAGLTGVVAIAFGLYHGLGLVSNGTVVGWGDNGFGEITIPPGLTNVVAIVAGSLHSLALKSDGTVIGWGYNSDGQTTVPIGLSNVVAIAAGYYNSSGLRSDGTVMGWGYDGNGETNVPPGLNGVVAIAGGGFHNLALKRDGTVVGWGYNGDGEVTIPGGLNGVVAVAGGYQFSLALAARPGPPVALSAAIIATNEVDLSWSEYSSGVTGFEIDRAPDAAGSPGSWAQIATLGGNVTTYHDTGVVANATYWYRTLAYNSCTASPFSALKVPTTLVLDDTWSSGVNTNQNLPMSSAWWASTPGTLTAVTSNMTFTVAGSALQAITYFTPDTNSPPIQLNIGDTLTATFKFIPSGIPPNGTSSQGFRFGLFDFADGNNNPKRISGDGFGSSSQGSGVAGYALFGKVYGKFSDATPIDVRKRINLADGSLLGTSGDFTSLAKDSLTTNSFGGFANLTPYSLQFVLQRTGLNSIVITIT